MTRSQLRQILTTATVLLSHEEAFALERRYNDDLGFNYTWFLQELEAEPITEALYHQMLEDKRRLNAERGEIPLESHEDETNIVLILAKIKAKIVRERIRVIRCSDPFVVS